MAGKRMFRLDVIDTDAFLEMPLSTQALYFHLNLRADDDGFIGNPKKILRMIGAQEDDLRLLIAKRFVIQFEDGVIVIKHWRMHNTLSANRYHETKYLEHKEFLLLKDNGAYSLNEGKKIDDSRLIESSKRQANKGLLEDRRAIDASKTKKDEQKTSAVEEEVVEEEKNNKRKNNKKEKPDELFNRLSLEYSFSDRMKQSLTEWFEYKTERKDSFVESGMRKALTQIQNKINSFGEDYVIEVVNNSMAHSWQGLTWDSVKVTEVKTTPSYKSIPKEKWDSYMWNAAIKDGFVTQEDFREWRKEHVIV